MQETDLRDIKYIHVDYMTSEQILKDIESGDVDKMHVAILSACLYGDDYELAIDLCQKFFQHPSVKVRQACIMSVAYLFLNFGRADINLANKIIEYGLKDATLELKGTIEFAIDDLKEMCKGYEFLTEMGLKHIDNLSQTEVLSNLDSNDSQKIIHAIISSSMYGTDYNLDLTICDTQISNPDKNVKIACIYALVYILFFNFHELNKQVAHNVLQKGLTSSDKKVKYVAKEIIKYLDGFDGFSAKTLKKQSREILEKSII